VSGMMGSGNTFFVGWNFELKSPCHSLCAVNTFASALGVDYDYMLGQAVTAGSTISLVKIC
jgi:hypothetical protein